MSETTRRPGDILGEMICVAQVDEFEAILGILPEHEAAVLTVQKWVNDIQCVDLQEAFGTEEGFWEVMGHRSWGQAVPRNHLNQNSLLSREFWFSTQKGTA